MPKNIYVVGKDHKAMTTNHMSEDQTSWRLSKANLPKPTPRILSQYVHIQYENVHRLDF